MKNKISSIELAMFFTLVSSSLYLGLGDILLLNTTNHSILISMVIGTILGFIPTLMYLKINNYYPNLNLYQKNKKLFGNIIGNIINLIIFIILILLLIISYRTIVIFLLSKYLQTTPYIVVGLLVLITVIVLSKNKIETIVRVFQILFLIAVIIIFLTEILLAKYIEIDNILPIFNNNYINEIIKGSIFYACMISFPSLLFLIIKKDQISNTKKLTKHTLLFYLLGTYSLTMVMFFIISCFGYDVASLFRYPEYILLKKIIISNSDLHIENLLAFRWIFYPLSLCCLCTYSIKERLEELKISNKKVLIILTIISLATLYLSKDFFTTSIEDSILLFSNIFIPVIALPIFIILIILFIRTMFIKKT